MTGKTVFLLLLAASVAAAQTATQPATHTATQSTHKAAVHHASARAGKLPPGIPVVHGVIHTAFSLRYQDYKIGTGPLAEPNKLYRVQYTGYLAATGQKFDSSYDHRAPVFKDGKPVMGPDGKPELGEAEPLVFPQGYGRLIPGFDEGFTGMRVGGKRRIFVPWQLGYGTRAIPARGDHPGIPAKSDLIFDVELVSVTDMPTMPPHPLPAPPHPGITPGRPFAPPPHPNGASQTPGAASGAAGAEQKPAAAGDKGTSGDVKKPPQ